MQVNSIKLSGAAGEFTLVALRERTVTRHISLFNAQGVQVLRFEDAWRASAMQRRLWCSAIVTEVDGTNAEPHVVTPVIPMFESLL